MLTLPITKKWLKEIDKGRKTEEYREFKPFYFQRLQRYLNQPVDIILRNGYRSTSPYLKVNVTVTLGIGKPEWGADPDKYCYVLKINKIYR